MSMRHCQLMSEVGAFADAEWEEHGQFVAGELGFQAVHRVGVGMSHPPLPIFAYYLGLTPCGVQWGHRVAVGHARPVVPWP